MSADDTDGDARTQTQSAALRAKAWTSLDIAHVAEAIETIGMHEKRAMSRR